MPAKSKSQWRLMAACSHGADYENCPEMTSKQFNDYVRSGQRGLPERVGNGKKKSNRKKTPAGKT